MNDQASTSASGESHDLNQHIYEFLNYYTDFAEPPKYAVLIDGPWGVGKTHLVNRFLNLKFGGRSEDFVYISLFGLNSTKDNSLVLLTRLRMRFSSRLLKMGSATVLSQCTITV